MTALVTSAVVFAVLVVAIFAGAFIRSLVPESHIAGDSKAAIQSAIALVATMAALVAGLLVATAKSSYDAQESQINQMTANVIMVDRLLAEYGPEARPARELLRRGVDKLADQIWGDKSKGLAKPFEMTSEAEALFLMIEGLTPKGDIQQSVRSQTITAINNLAQARLLLLAQRHQSIPTLFLATLVFWLALIFVSFSLFAPTNTAVVTALLLSSLACSGAIFLILEMDQPFSGLIAISSEPLRNALSALSP